MLKPKKVNTLPPTGTHPKLGKNRHKRAMQATVRANQALRLVNRADGSWSNAEYSEKEAEFSFQRGKRKSKHVSLSNGRVRHDCSEWLNEKGHCIKCRS